MSSRKRAELEQRRERLARNEQLARTGPPRARFAYAAAATKQRARIARLELELEREQPQRAARIFIGRSRTGEAWHWVPRPGTAFPVAACGSNVERSSYQTTDKPADGIAFHPWQCDKCRAALLKEDS